MFIRSYIVKTYAKINITLDITGIRNDGMHTLRSIVTFINIFDTIYLTIGKEGDITFIGADIENSTVHRLKDLTGIPLSATIYKNIPIGRGLGGSSSNAGGLLALFTHLRLIEREKAKEIAPQIGADVSMYLETSPLLMEGIGEQITSMPHINIPKELYLLIPPFSASTPMVYRAWDENPIYTDYTSSFINGGNPGNALSEAFSRIFGISLPSGVYLTGSGSSMFTLYPPTKIPDDWDIMLVSTVKKGWEMMECGG